MTQLSTWETPFSGEARACEWGRHSFPSHVGWLPKRLASVSTQWGELQDWGWREAGSLATRTQKASKGQILLSSSLDSSREVVHKLRGLSSMDPRNWPTSLWSESLCVCMDRNVREPLQTVSMKRAEALSDSAGLGKSTQTWRSQGTALGKQNRL